MIRKTALVIGASKGGICDAIAKEFLRNFMLTLLHGVE
jgi:NAD(P)-dependent dehydrogenase (short-subunit alcohol dehydrogenase family)